MQFLECLTSNLQIYINKTINESNVYSFEMLMLEVIYCKSFINFKNESSNKDYFLMHSAWQAYETSNILNAYIFDEFENL